MKTNWKKLIMAALMAAIACVATIIIKIPSPLNGYLNLGDAIILFAGWVISPVYGFAAAAIGSALADIFSGYAVYAPATFLIKGVMALVAFYGFKLLNKKIPDLPSRIISGVAAEAVMIGGYYIFEGFLYGFTESLVNIPANVIQGAVGLTAGVLLIKIFEKAKIKLN